MPCIDSNDNLHQCLLQVRKTSFTLGFTHIHICPDKGLIQICMFLRRKYIIILVHRWQCMTVTKSSDNWSSLKGKAEKGHWDNHWFLLTEVIFQSLKVCDDTVSKFTASSPKHSDQVRGMAWNLLCQLICKTFLCISDDRHRVKLHSLLADPSSDYVNANYIDVSLLSYFIFLLPTPSCAYYTSRPLLL